MKKWSKIVREGIPGIGTNLPASTARSRNRSRKRGGPEPIRLTAGRGGTDKTSNLGLKNCGSMKLKGDEEKH